MKTEKDVNDEGLKKEHPVAKGIGFVLTAICMFGLGWIIKGMLPDTPDGMPPGMMPPPPGDPLVRVESVAEEALNPPSSFIGHVEPIKDVNLVSRISGYVKEVNFKEGSLVKEGDLLFVIDREPYEALAAVRKAELGQALAEVDRAESYEKRLLASDTRGITQADLDKARSDAARSRAAVKQAEAQLLLAEIDLKYTHITAPIAGRIGRTLANIGEYVSPSTRSLARIVQVNPVRVVFSVTDRDFIGVRERIADDKMNAELRLRLKLPTGTVLDCIGERDFEDNEMSSATATLQVRARFDNSDGLLVPNGYVTVLVDAKAPAKYPVVAQSALVRGGDGSEYVYVISDQLIAQKRKVVTGDILDGRVELHQGVQPMERVAVEGVQGIVDGQPVRVAECSVAALTREPAVSEKEGETL